jgi:hypothetical protein
MISKTRGIVQILLATSTLSSEAFVGITVCLSILPYLGIQLREAVSIRASTDTKYEISGIGLLT